MPDNDDNLIQLQEKLDTLQKKQDQFYTELEEIRSEIRRLRLTESESLPVQEITGTVIKQEAGTTDKKIQTPADTELVKPKKASWFDKSVKPDIEKFIGENLINKIGILITIIGVAIGTRYAIDHDLISPLMRISLGYFVGLVLLLISLRLKSELSKFSAVLFSGAMAVFYITTFAAYSFYGMLAMLSAFLIMVLITVITVAASIWYNREVVAHIALVGAYAIPFLVGGEGSVSTLFLFMVIINTGVLSVAVYKYWKVLTISAFVFTWLIFGAWYTNEYSTTEHFTIALAYAGIFFLLLYLATLANKLIQKDIFRRADIWLILANSFVFYGFGFAILSGHNSGSTWLGAFTLGIAAIHLAAAVFVYRSGLPDKNLIYFTAGLAVTFFTISIPVELEGNWITLLWTGEAVVLFLIGRSRNVSFYEKMSYPILALAFISLIIDWNNAYSLYKIEHAETGFMVLFNIHFFTSLFFITGLAWIVRNDYQSETRPLLFRNQSNHILIRQLLWTVLVIAVYFTFRLEIQGFFNNLFIESKTISDGGFQSGNRYILRFGTLWVYNYTMLFISLLMLTAIYRLRNKDFALILFVSVVICTVLFIQNGLAELDVLKERFLGVYPDESYDAGIIYIGIRYVCFLFLGWMLYSAGRLVRQNAAEGGLKFIYDALLYISLLWILSDEVILWMDAASVEQPHKLGLTILWGVYAVLIIVLGIRKGKKHMRVGAIILLGITLVKLFFYDISHLDAIARTIVFLTLGILLLLASFLYNKFQKELG